MTSSDYSFTDEEENYYFKSHPDFNIIYTNNYEKDTNTGSKILART